MRCYRPAVLMSFGLFLGLWALTAQPAFGQVSASGVDQFGTFQRNLIQTMNLYNLNNHLEIPVFEKKERGANFSAGLVSDFLDSLVITQNCSSCGPGSHFVLGSLGLTAVDSVAPVYHAVYNQTCTSSYPNQAANIYPDYIEDQRGTVHSIRQGVYSVIMGRGCNAGIYSVPTPDGWLMTFQYTNLNCTGLDCITSVNATDPSGNVYNRNSGTTRTMTDTNGNQITNTTVTQNTNTTTWTDPTGQTVFTSVNTSPEAFSYAAPNGQTATVQFTMSSGYNIQTQFGCTGVSELNYTNTSVLSGISLADGTSYGLVYESTNGTYPSTTVTGRIHSIRLPTGGTYTYTYSGGTKGINCFDGYPAILTIAGSDGSIWTYNRTICESLSCLSTSVPYVTTVVTDPACNDTVYSFDGSGLQIQVQSYQGTSGTANCPASTKTLLKTTKTCYSGNYTNCGSQWGNTPVSQIDLYTYLPGISQPSLSETFYNSAQLPTQVNEFDFGVNTGAAPTTTPLKATKITYASIANNILNRPSCVQVTGGTSPTTCGTVTSTTKSITNYLNYSATGNVGTIQSWISGTTYASRSFTYYSTGLVDTGTDPMQHTTTYTYNACNNSYVTNVAKPLSLSTSMTWDCSGGVPLTSTDENQQVTTFKYGSDPLWRMTEIDYPDGGQTSMQYNDTASPPNSVEFVLMDSSHTIKTQTNVDGFDRPVRSITSAVPAMNPATLTVDTSYDKLGRIYQVSNPYYSTSDSTYGVTTSLYDALGRKVEQKNPDGTTVRWWCYEGLNLSGQPNCHTHISTVTTGDWVDAADEDGNDWQDTTDALGRLISAEEPSGGAAGTGAKPSLETRYSYDALGNLLSITQCGAACTSAPVGAMVRTFTYDGISRLTNATNPESGAASYTYDGNGNVVTRTTPAVNVSTGTQTIGYCYDALGRVTYKFYSGTFNCQSPNGYATSYAYDSSAIAGSARVAGRLTDEKAFIGGTLISERSLYQYDPMGRITAEQQTPYKPTSGSFLFLYGYDLKGDLICSNNGFAALTATNSCSSLSATASTIALHNQYDGFGRLEYIYTTLQPSTFSTAPPYLMQANSSSPVAYNAMGELTLARLGLVTSNAASYGIQLTRSFDKRGRLVSNVAGSLYSLGANGSTPIYDSAGNLASYSDSVMGNWSFTYDTLNRLVGTTVTSGPYAGEYGCWTYDTFGNRTLEAFTQKSTTPCAPGAPIGSPYTVTTPTANNQVSGFVYDAAGDVVSDGRNNYAYDAEGRLCAKATGLPGGGTSYTEYLYDAEGRRVAKVPGTSRSCAAPAATPSNLYLLGPGGEQVTEVNGSGTPLHSNVFLPAGVIGTYDFAHGGFHMTFADQVGTKRVQAAIASNGTTVTATSELQFQSFPFGNDRTNTFGGTIVGSGADATEQHFTGKEHDTETGDDYFGARYYSNVTGRFLSPDPSRLMFADLTKPQSLNLYGYVQNNPLINVDPDGLECVWDDGSYDSEFDKDTGSVGQCQKAGGTWIELGYNGGWSGSSNSQYAGWVNTITNNAENGSSTLISTYNSNTGIYSFTHYNTSGLVDMTGTSGTITTFGYSPGSVDAQQIYSVFNPALIRQVVDAGQAIQRAQQDPYGNYQNILMQTLGFMVSHPFGKDLAESCSGYLEFEAWTLAGLSGGSVYDALVAKAGYQSAAAVAAGKIGAAYAIGSTGATLLSTQCNAMFGR